MTNPEEKDRLHHAKQNAKAWLQSLRDWRDQVDGEERETRIEALQDEIREAPLSVQVRSGWTDPGALMEAEEFEILLTTGGPALRIMGDLDVHGEPRRAYMQVQEWGVPWTDYYESGNDGLLLWFAGYFHYKI